MSLNRRFRNGAVVRLQRHLLLSQKGSTTARLQHNADGTYSERADQAQADDLLGNFIPTRHTFKGNFVWALPQTCTASRHGDEDARLRRSTTGSCRACGPRRPAPPTPSACRTRAARPATATRTSPARRTTAAASASSATPGSGCSSDPLRQFIAAGVRAAAGEQRRARVGRRLPARLLPERVRHVARAQHPDPRGQAAAVPARRVQRANQAIVTGRNTTLSVQSPTDPTPVNLPYDAITGNTVVARSLPKNVGFGVATATRRRARCSCRFGSRSNAAGSEVLKFWGSEVLGVRVRGSGFDENSQNSDPEPRTSERELESLNFRTPELQNSRTTKHQNYRTTELQNYRTTELQNPEPRTSMRPLLAAFAIFLLSLVQASAQDPQTAPAPGWRPRTSGRRRTRSRTRRQQFSPAAAGTRGRGRDSRAERGFTRASARRATALIYAAASRADRTCCGRSSCCSTKRVSRSAR